MDDKKMRENVQKWFQRTVRDKGVEGLKAEFASLKKPMDPATATVFMQQPQGTRNRYRDVICLDSTRVVLKNADNDYIHANFVSSPQSEKRFICTQGPTDSTCGEFWRMVLQERAQVIIMLCNVYEKQLKKCAEYFPAKTGESVNFEGFSIQCRVQKNFDLPRECSQGIQIRVSGLVVTVESTKQQHFVDHYQWVDWPDRGVPPGDMTPVALLTAVRMVKQPIVIHCSAGIGRTGSIVMIQYVMEAFGLGQSFERSDEILNRIREQRALSIQTDQQYLYVHRVLMEYFYRRGFFDADQAMQIKKFAEDYNRATQ